MPKTLYTVLEHFKNKDALPVYRRFRDRGRLAPDGLVYISSWVDHAFERCFQLMETDDPALLEAWMAQWNDLVDFEVHAVGRSHRRKGAARGAELSIRCLACDHDNRADRRSALNVGQFGQEAR